MPTILPELLKPSYVRTVLSRIRTPGNVFSRFFGFNIGGGNITPVVGRQYTYDIFDNVRTVAAMRAPGTPAGSVNANPVGNVTVTLARANEKLPLDYEKLLNIRQLGENAGTRDKMGIRYIDQQATQLKRKQENLREVIVGSLFRGGQYGVVNVGDDWIPTYDTSNTLYNVDFRIPSTNKLIGGSFAAGLTMGSGGNIITASWATASTDIPAAIDGISVGFQRIVGQPLRHILCPRSVWRNVLQNDKVRQLAGTANKPYEKYEMLNDTNDEGFRLGVFSAEIDAIPGVLWHIYDGGLEVHTVATATGGNAAPYVQTLPDNYATFMIEYDGMWMRGIEGSEYVKDNVIAPAKEISGFYAWTKERDDPTTVELHTLQNFGIELNTPGGIAVARVQ